MTVLKIFAIHMGLSPKRAIRLGSYLLASLLAQPLTFAGQSLALTPQTRIQAQLPGDSRFATLGSWRIEGLADQWTSHGTRVGLWEIDSSVSLIPTEERGFKLAVELAVTLPSVDDADEAAELVRAAHLVCPYSNATRGNIEVSLTANGHGIEETSHPAMA